MLKVIGRGANGSVYTCSLSDGSVAAVKEVYLPDIGPSATDEQQTAVLEPLLREVEIVMSLEHPNIIEFYGSQIDRAQNRLLIFMELVPNGSLGAFVRSMKTPLLEETARVYAAQIVSALAYIHERNVMHRDLKCDNVLLTETGRVKLADFGASRVAKGGTAGAKTLIGTPFFMAPELLNSGDGVDDGYGRRADVWSLGITILEMVNQGRMPWPEFPSINAAILHIASDDALPVVPAGLSQTFKEFISCCCCRDPLQRHTSAQLLAHPWLVAQQDRNAAVTVDALY
jgi:serine/threonine protein kinase